MYQVKLALSLLLVALNAAVLKAEYKSSQCKAWYNKHNHPQGMVPSSSSAQLLRKEDITAFPSKVLVRRITPTQNPQPIASGSNSACGVSYDSNVVSGGCLWTGNTNHPDNVSSGWLSGDNKKNCNKKIYVKDAAGATHYTTVIEGCGMNIADLDTGCANLWVTEALFNKLAGAEKDGAKLISNWDFDQSNPAF